MILIGLFGGSGSGKTTVSHILKDKIDHAILIQGDPLMHDISNLYKNEIIHQLQLDIGPHYWTNYLATSFENVQKSFEIMGDQINQGLLDKIYEKADDDSVVIIDWAFLPLVSLYEKCDYTISVGANLDIKQERIHHRSKTSGELKFWQDQTLENRFRFSDLTNFGYSAKYHIENNGSFQELELKVNSFLKEFNRDIFTKKKLS